MEHSAYLAVAVQVIIGLVTLAGTLASLRVGLRGVNRRVGKVEQSIEALPKNYVPRREVQLALSHLRSVTSQIHEMVTALLGRRELQAAAEDCPPATTRTVLLELLLEITKIVSAVRIQATEDSLASRAQVLELLNDTLDKLALLSGRITQLP